MVRAGSEDEQRSWLRAGSGDERGSESRSWSGDERRSQCRAWSEDERGSVTGGAAVEKGVVRASAVVGVDLESVSMEPERAWESRSSGLESGPESDNGSLRRRRGGGGGREGWVRVEQRREAG